jgi:hypothetical protein
MTYIYIAEKIPVAAIGWLRRQKLTGHRRPARIVGHLSAPDVGKSTLM